MEGKTFDDTQEWMIDLGQEFHFRHPNDSSVAFHY